MKSFNEMLRNHYNFFYLIYRDILNYPDPCKIAEGYHFE